MKEKLRLNCGVTAELCHSHSRVPSAMIGQYTLKPDTHSNRDTGTRECGVAKLCRDPIVQSELLIRVSLLKTCNLIYCYR